MDSVDSIQLPQVFGFAQEIIWKMRISLDWFCWDLFNRKPIFHGENMGKPARFRLGFSQSNQSSDNSNKE